MDFRKRPLTVSDINKEGFKVDYSRLKKAVMSCEIEGKNSDSCKRVLKDLGIDVIEDG